MTLEQYRAKKIAELSMIPFSTNPLLIEQSKDNIKAFLSQTIDELWALPNRSDLSQIVQDSQGSVCPSPEEIAEEVGWNACIAEAERMRDLTIKEKG